MNVIISTSFYEIIMIEFGKYSDRISYNEYS